MIDLPPPPAQARSIVQVLNYTPENTFLWPHLQRPNSKCYFVSNMHFQSNQEMTAAPGPPSSSAPDPSDPNLRFQSRWRYHPPSFLSNHSFSHESAKEGSSFCFLQFLADSPLTLIRIFLEDGTVSFEKCLHN